MTDHTPYAPGIAEQMERTDWTPEQALRWYAEGKHFDTVDGRTRIIDTGSVASNALKHASLDYLETKGDAALAEVTRQRDILAQAIGEAVTKAGIIREGVGLSGPQLLQFLGDLVDCVERINLEGRTITLSGCQFLEEDLIRRAVRAVRGSRRNTLPRWALVRDAFGTGSGVATALCCRFNLDPDEVMKN